MDVSDRRMQVQLTQEAKIASDFFFIGAIFAVVGFVSALTGAPRLWSAGIVVSIRGKVPLVSALQRKWRGNSPPLGGPGSFDQPK